MEKELKPMLKSVRVILLILFIIPTFAMAYSDFDLNEGNYTAIVKIDETGELSKRGKISVPYFLTFVHDINTGLVYGSMVRTELIFDKKGNPDGFGLAHNSVINVKIRNEKKIKFDVMLGETTVMKKVKGTFSDSANVITLALRNSSNKKVKQTFARSDHAFNGIYLGDASKKIAPSSTYYSRRGKVMLLMRFFPKNSATAAGLEVGDYLLAYFDKINAIANAKGALTDSGDNRYWGNNETTHDMDFQLVLDGKNRAKTEIKQECEWTKSILTIMGGNGKSPKPLDEEHIVVRRTFNAVVIILRNPQNIDPGCIVSVGNPWVGSAGVNSMLDDTWDKGEDLVEEKNLRIGFTVPTEFSGALVVTLTNPDGKSSSFVVNVP